MNARKPEDQWSMVIRDLERSRFFSATKVFLVMA